MVVANADPAPRAGVQGGLHINAKLLGGIRLPVGQPVESVQVYNRQTEALSQGAAQGRLAGAYGAPNGDARPNGESSVHSRRSLTDKQRSYNCTGTLAGLPPSAVC